MMIVELNATDQETARRIHNLSLASYRVEADLLGVKGFPPLSETIDTITKSSCTFYGTHLLSDLVGVIEVEFGLWMQINRLVVCPEHMRKGIGRALLTYVVSLDEQITVTTAMNNIPTIQLYHSMGFEVYKKYQVEGNLTVVEFRKRNMID